MDNRTENGVLVIFLEGRIDSSNAQKTEEEISGLIGGLQARDFLFDADKLVYISSAGLRVFLSAQKAMNKQGTMVVRNAGESVMEVFEVTGFTDILTIE